MTQAEYENYIETHTKKVPQGNRIAFMTQKEPPAIHTARVSKEKQPQGAKTTKYRNKKVTVDGIVFDSQKEAARWQQLKLMESSGKISELQRQAVFVLAPSVVLDGRRKPAIRYLADFAYFHNGKQVIVIEDVKSAATKGLAAYRIKKHLMMSVHKLAIIEV